MATKADDRKALIRPIHRFLLDTPDSMLSGIGVIYMEFHSADFFPRLCNKLNETHVIHEAKIRFPHRGEVAWIRKDLLAAEQKNYEIRPAAENQG